MISQNLKTFCRILYDDFYIQTYTAYGVMVDLKSLLSEIKSEILIEISNNYKSTYLDYLLNEVQKTNAHKFKNEDEIKKWLNKYDTTIDEVLNENIVEKQIFKLLDIDTYNYSNEFLVDERIYEPEYADASSLRYDFIIYFRWTFSNQLISFINSYKSIESPTKKVDRNEFIYKSELLDKFCYEIENIQSLKRNSFLQCYDFGIIAYTESLKEEILENLVILPDSKILPYLVFIKSKISRTDFFKTPSTILDLDLLAYDLKDTLFPYRENKDLKFYLSTSYYATNVDSDHRENMYDLQHKFFEYASMIEAKKIVEFIDQRLAELNVPDDNNIENIEEKDDPTDNTIFKTNGYETFKTIFTYLKINKSNIKRHGYQAKAMSVWDYPKSRDMIFKATTLKKDYINYLNENYNTNYSPKSMSDGSKFIPKIKEYLESVKLK